MTKLLLIGNGPSALAKQMGNQIDNYDGFVLRFNAYVTEGFESCIGSRTDFWWTGADCDKRIAAEQLHHSRFIAPKIGDRVQDVNMCKELKATLIPYLWHERAVKEMNCNYPTSGAKAVLYFLDKEYEIELWGFDFMQTDRPHHYLEDEKNVHGENHDGDKEWLFFNRLLESGRIRYFGHNPETEGIPIIRQPVPCGTKEDPEWARKSTHEGWYEWFGQKFAGGSFLDVGAGLGGGMKVLHKYSKYVAGFEIDERMEQHGIVIGENLERFADESYDVVVCVDVIEHVVEDLILFRDMKRIAKKAVCITTPNATRTKAKLITHCREYTIAQFANIFRPDEIWSGSPDGGDHITKLITFLRHTDKFLHLIDLSTEYTNRVPLETRFNNTHDGAEWACIAAIFYTADRK